MEWALAAHAVEGARLVPRKPYSRLRRPAAAMGSNANNKPLTSLSGLFYEGLGIDSTWHGGPNPAAEPFNGPRERRNVPIGFVSGS